MVASELWIQCDHCSLGCCQHYHLVSLKIYVQVALRTIFRNYREGLMCIILGAIFEIGFEPAMDTAKDIGNNSNIKLAVHWTQIGDYGTGRKVEELQILNWFIGLLVYLHDQTGYTTNNYLASCRISS